MEEGIPVYLCVCEHADVSIQLRAQPQREALFNFASIKEVLDPLAIWECLSSAFARLDVGTVCTVFFSLSVIPHLIRPSKFNSCLICSQRIVSPGTIRIFWSLGEINSAAEFPRFLSVSWLPTDGGLHPQIRFPAFSAAHRLHELHKLFFLGSANNRARLTTSSDPFPESVCSCEIAG